MRILLINHYAGAHKYGMEFRPLYLARNWVAAGHEVTILAADQSHIRAKNPQFGSSDLQIVQGLPEEKFQAEMIEGVRYIWCKTPFYKGNGLRRVINICIFLLRLFQMIGWLKNQFPADVVVTSSTYPMDIFPAKWMKRNWNTKLIYEVHDLWPLSPIELGGMSRSHPFILWVQMAEDLSYRWSDKVISMLPKAKDYMVSRGMPSAKFYYLPNGIDFGEWASDENIPVNIKFEKSVLEIRKNFKTLVGYFGTHGLANALESYLEAAELSEKEGLSVAFVLVGTGPDKLALQKKVSDRKLKNVFFLDPIAKSEIPKGLQLFDLLYIGLQRQSLFRFGISPNKLIDYMAAAKPILFAIDAGNNPVLEAGCGFSVPPEDPIALVAAVKKFETTTVEQRKQLGENGLRYVRANHDYQVLAAKFLQQIQTL